MLVISRRPSETLVFPDQGITVHILEPKGNKIRVGVEAPPEVKILRGELQAEAARARPTSHHALCNRLNKLSLALQLAERQVQAGRTQEANATLRQALAVLETLDQDLAGTRAAPPPRSAKVCRTLIVDDDTNERELLAGLLHLNGCECSTAADGQDALEYLASHDRPDVVLLDLWMPRCDGASTLRQIRSDPRYQGLKVFAISSTPPTDLGVGTGPDGFDAWFPKPLRPGELCEAMRRVLNPPLGPN